MILIYENKLKVKKGGDKECKNLRALKALKRQGFIVIKHNFIEVNFCTDSEN